MDTAYAVVTVLTVVVTAVIAVADFVPARFVLANSASVGVPRTWLTPLGLTKLAGAAGLVLGLAGVPLIGEAAAGGLVLFFLGAVATHLRAGDRTAALGFPATYLALAAATLALGIAA